MIFKKIYNRYCLTGMMAMLFGFAAYGQQSQPFTQYLFNRFLLNPAACGSDGYTSIGVTVKDQWSGFTYAPTNQTLTAQARLSREGLFGHKIRRPGKLNRENIGVGLALFNDIRGPIRTTGAQFSYAYHLEDRLGQLSFGMSASLFQLRIDRNKITTETEDHFLNASSFNSIIPDASFGIHYTTRDYYAGFSATNLFQSIMMFGGRNSKEYRIERQYLLLGGYIFEVNDDWCVVPGTQIKFNERGIGQIDLNVMGYYHDQFWGGLSYRSGGGSKSYGSTSVMFGARYKQYCFGYAFDYSLSSIRKYTYGSHELVFSMAFGLGERFFRYNNKRYGFQNNDPQSIKRKLRY